MTPPLTIPLSAADRPVLAAIVARLWPAEARQQGVDPSRVSAIVLADPWDGLLWAQDRDGMSCFKDPAEQRALDGLADALRDHGLVVDGRRVVGWAATRPAHEHTLTELDANRWASCGPASLSALLGRPLADVRHAFPGQTDGRTWTNLAAMQRALTLLGVGHGTERSPGILMPASAPSFGLAMVQFCGPWDDMPIGHPAQLQRSHWIAMKPHPTLGAEAPLVFDINAIDGFPPMSLGWWQPQECWDALIRPELARSYGKKATGAWWLRAVIEVTAPPLTRIIDLDGLDPRRVDHEDATTAARLARDAAAAGPVVADAKREHGIGQARAARRAGR